MIRGRDFLAVSLSAVLILAACSPAGSSGGGAHGLAVSISPNGGTFAAAVTVSLASDPAGAEIRYTTDGAEPGAGKGAAYSAPFSLAASSTLRAWARLAATNETATAGASFTITSSAASTIVPASLWGRWSMVPLDAIPTTGFLESCAPAFRMDGLGVDVQIRRRSDGLIYTGRDAAPTAASDGSSVAVRAALSSQGRAPLQYGFALNFDAATGELEGRSDYPDDDYGYFRLFRSDPEPVRAVGRILAPSASPGSRTLVPAAGIGLVIRNALTQAELGNSTTNSEGAFEAEGLLVGTSYIATGFDGVPLGVVTESIPFTVTMDGQDAGSFPLKGAGDNYRIGLSQPDIFDSHAGFVPRSLL